MRENVPRGSVYGGVPRLLERLVPVWHLIDHVPTVVRSALGRRFLKIVSIAVASLVLLVVVAVAGFRFSAWARETDERATLAPASGRLVRTASGAIFLQDSGPRQGVPVVLFHGTAA